MILFSHDFNLFCFNIYSVLIFIFVNSNLIIIFLLDSQNIFLVSGMGGLLLFPISDNMFTISHYFNFGVGNRGILLFLITIIILAIFPSFIDCPKLESCKQDKNDNDLPCLLLGHSNVLLYDQLPSNEGSMAYRHFLCNRMVF